MKKLMFGLVAAAAIMAMGADAIESANTVGFVNKVGMGKGYTICPVTFDEVAGEGTVDIFKYINFAVMPTPGSANDTASCTEILVQNGNGYLNYAYVSDGVDQESWEEGKGWAETGSGLLFNEIMVGVGQGVWIKNPETTAIDATISGQVFAEASKTITLGTYEYNLCGNPFPVATAFEDIQWTDLPIGSSVDPNAGVQILVQNGNGYLNYVYCNDGVDQESWEEGTGWAETGSGLLFTGKFAEAGQGFWLYAPKGVAAKATFLNPLAK